jgi:uncharacterized membrane protein YeiH
MSCQTNPRVLTSDFYATASLIGALLYLLLSRTSMPFFMQISITALTVTTIRARHALQGPAARGQIVVGNSR